MQEITEKQKYELWREYLKESEKYKVLCRWFRKKEKDPDLKWFEDEQTSMGLRLTFGFFGDVFSNSFEGWWENKKDKDSGIPIYGDTSMEYSKRQAVYEFNSAVRRFVESHGREPNLDELREAFIDAFLIICQQVF